MSAWLPFNDWSQERIKEGRKFCTSRTKPYLSDPRVQEIRKETLEFVRDFLWQVEGANSPEEFEKIWNEIHPKKQFDKWQIVYVHFGDFRPNLGMVGRD